MLNKKNINLFINKIKITSISNKCKGGNGRGSISNKNNNSLLSKVCLHSLSVKASHC